MSTPTWWKNLTFETNLSIDLLFQHRNVREIEMLLQQFQTEVLCEKETKSSFLSNDTSALFVKLCQFTDNKSHKNPKSSTFSSHRMHAFIKHVHRWMVHFCTDITGDSRRRFTTVRPEKRTRFSKGCNRTQIHSLPGIPQATMERSHCQTIYGEHDKGDIKDLGLTAMMLPKRLCHRELLSCTHTPSAQQRRRCENCRTLANESTVPFCPHMPAVCSYACALGLRCRLAFVLWMHRLIKANASFVEHTSKLPISVQLHFQDCAEIVSLRNGSWSLHSPWNIHL